MNPTLILLTLTLVLLPALAAGAQTPVATTDGQAPAATDTLAPAAPAAPVAAVRSAIADAFRKADQPACSDETGLGCAIAETALGSALSDEREQYRANEAFLER